MEYGKFIAAFAVTIFLAVPAFAETAPVSTTLYGSQSVGVEVNNVKYTVRYAASFDYNTAVIQVNAGPAVILDTLDVGQTKSIGGVTIRVDAVYDISSIDSTLDYGTLSIWQDLAVDTPTITVMHSPANPVFGEVVTFTATATGDITGKIIRLRYAGINNCNLGTSICNPVKECTTSPCVATWDSDANTGWAAGRTYNYNASLDSGYVPIVWDPPGYGSKAFTLSPAPTACSTQVQTLYGGQSCTYGNYIAKLLGVTTDNKVVIQAGNYFDVISGIYTSPTDRSGISTKLPVNVEVQGKSLVSTTDQTQNIARFIIFGTTSICENYADACVMAPSEIPSTCSNLQTFYGGQNCLYGSKTVKLLGVQVDGQAVVQVGDVSETIAKGITSKNFGDVKVTVQETASLSNIDQTRNIAALKFESVSTTPFACSNPQTLLGGQSCTHTSGAITYTVKLLGVQVDGQAVVEVNGVSETIAKDGTSTKFGDLKIYVKDSASLSTTDQTQNAATLQFSITTWPASCTDSDGGKDYYVKGTVLIKSVETKSEKTDYCETHNVLVEMYCGNNKIAQQERYTCMGGCRSGACIKAPTCTQKEQRITVVSDAQTMVIKEPSPTGSVRLIPAVPTWSEHTSWTAKIDGATWIWSEYRVSDPSRDTTVKFSRKFDVPADMRIDTASAVIAADNTYSCTLNGVSFANDQSSYNFADTDKDTYDIKSKVKAGTNELICTVKNIGSSNAPLGNPAGLLYRIEILTKCDDDSSQCSSLGATCGGIIGLYCCSGLKCQLDGNYFDAAGKCVRDITPIPPPEQANVYEKELAQGWNMFSIPVVLKNKEFSSLKTDCRFTSVLWELNQESQKFQRASVIRPGRGYWVKAADSCSTIAEYTQAVSLADYPIEASKGWNFIGSQFETIPFLEVTANCDVISGPYWYNPETRTYETAPSMESGKGYIVRVRQACTLTTDDSSPPSLPTTAAVARK